MKMNKKVVPFSVAGIAQIEKDIADLKAQMNGKVEELLSRMAELGADRAKVNFEAAKYAGENDVVVRWEKRDAKKVAVVATGNATLFIEFGTGITYDTDHPERPAGLAAPGTYGKGNAGKLQADGSPKPWAYKGPPGNAGWQAHKKGKDGNLEEIPGLSKTLGNPANMCMYDSEKYLEEEIKRVVEEVFGS